MPDLLKGLSPQKIDYVVSLPHSLLATISLMCAVPRYEGLSDWLQETRLRLSAGLRAELCLLVAFPGGYQRFTAELSGRLPAKAPHMSFDELMTYLQTLPGPDYQQMALRALARGAQPQPQPDDLLALLARPAEWVAYLANVESEAPPDTVASLVRDGEKLKKRLTIALSRFWHEIYAQEFEATCPLMERSVAYHQAQLYSSNFPDLFTTITGRLVPERVAALLPTVSQITFIPSCYVGPYVAHTHHDDNLILFYNCRSTPASSTVVDGAALYPPLKALADETRLQILALLRGRELYAQEIVDQLDISQPAVSRHLNLMAAADVLQIRREGNAKYYSINGEKLVQLAKNLRAFV